MAWLPVSSTISGFGDQEPITWSHALTFFSEKVSAVKFNNATLPSNAAEVPIIPSHTSCFRPRAETGAELQAGIKVMIYMSWTVELFSFDDVCFMPECASTKDSSMVKRHTRDLVPSFSRQRMFLRSFCKYFFSVGASEHVHCSFALFCTPFF